MDLFLGVNRNVMGMFLLAVKMMQKLVVVEVFMR